MLRSEVENAMLRKSDDLVKMAEDMGYLNGNIYPALQLNNGCHASSLLNFFDDNPGAMEAVQDWILKNSREIDEDVEEDEEEVEEEVPTVRPDQL